jgi:hypothetical protein
LGLKKNFEKNFAAQNFWFYKIFGFTKFTVKFCSIYNIQKKKFEILKILFRKILFRKILFRKKYIKNYSKTKNFLKRNFSMKPKIF